MATVSITIDHTKVSSTQTDFPVVVSGTYTSLRTISNGGGVANANGYDVLFFEDPGLTTRLKWEVEKYVATTGEVVYWVKIPILSSTVDTVFYMTYGDPSIVTDQSTPTQVWDANFKAVYHLNQSTGANSLDSTINSFTLVPTNSPVQTTGEIDGALDFNGIDQSTQNLGASDILNPLSTMTASTWIYVRDFAVPPSNINQRVFSMFGPVSGNAAQIVINTNTPDGNCFTGLIFDGGTSTSYTFFTPTTFTINNWYHVAMTWNGSTTMTIYVNGVSQSLTSTTGLAAGQNVPLILGARLDATPVGWFNGIIDEFKLSNINRSAGWIQTEYNNQSSPSTFYAISFPKTLGFTSVGGTTGGYVAFDNYYGCRFVASQSGTISSMSAYLSSTGTGNVTFGIYADSSGAPGALLATSTTTGSFTTSPAWTIGNISCSITSGSAYWLSIFGDDNTYYYYDAGSTNQYFGSGAGKTYPNFDNPAAINNYENQKISIYATFTPSPAVMIGIGSTLGIYSITF